MHAELLQCRLERCSIERLGEHISLMLATWAVSNVAVQPRLSIDLTCEWVFLDAREKHAPCNEPRHVRWTRAMCRRFGE
eukprot:9295872-Heterocapsa_arctica.AAC.1